MPKIFVFPGGWRWTRVDRHVRWPQPEPTVRARIGEGLWIPPSPHANPRRALREIVGGNGWIWEQRARWEWCGAMSHRLEKTFRRERPCPMPRHCNSYSAPITPAGPPTSLVMPFFMVDMWMTVASDPDNVLTPPGRAFASAMGALTRARSFDMPFITEVRVAESRPARAIRTPPSRSRFFQKTRRKVCSLRLKGQSAPTPTKPDRKISQQIEPQRIAGMPIASREVISFEEQREAWMLRISSTCQGLDIGRILQREGNDQTAIPP